MIATSDLIVPKEFLDSAKMSEDEMRIDLAVHLYATRCLSMGKAKELAGLDLISFQKEMATRDQCISRCGGIKTDLETQANLRT